MNALLILPLRPSPLLVGIAVLLFPLLSLSLLLTELAWWWRFPLFIVGLAGACHLLVSHGLRRGPFAITAVEWLGEGRWRFTDGRGVRREVRRSPGGLIHHRVVAVPFAAGWRRYSLLLVPDATDAESFRRLRVRLLSD